MRAAPIRTRQGQRPCQSWHNRAKRRVLQQLARTVSGTIVYGSSVSKMRGSVSLVDTRPRVDAGFALLTKVVTGPSLVPVGRRAVDCNRRRAARGDATFSLEGTELRNGGPVPCAGLCRLDRERCGRLSAVLRLCPGLWRNASDRDGRSRFGRACADRTMGRRRRPPHGRALALAGRRRTGDSHDHRTEARTAGDGGTTPWAHDAPDHGDLPAVMRLRADDSAAADGSTGFGYAKGPAALAAGPSFPRGSAGYCTDTCSPAVAPGAA